MHPSPQPQGTSLTHYQRWVLANGLAELLGLGGTLLLAGEAARAFPSIDQSPALIILTAIGAILAGTLLEGVLLGALQARALRHVLPHLQAREWISATALGAGLAWSVGMIPSTVIGLLTTGAATTPPTSAPEPSAAVQLALAVALGAVLGPFLGVPQGRLLRRHGGRLRTWVWANVVAWALGMPIVFAGMSSLPPAPGTWRLIGTIAASCLGTGLLVGAVHGRVLIHMLASRTDATTPLTRGAQS